MRKGKTYTLSFYEVELLRLLASARASRSRATSCSRRSGASRATPPRAASTTSSSSCARRSRRTPPSPAHIVTIYGTGYKLVP